LLLSETDCPYMAPVPLRGLECEPAMVAFTAACVAEAREKAGVASREQTYAAFWKNANSFFRLG
jgi:TatD DNase family protein